MTELTATTAMFAQSDSDGASDAHSADTGYGNSPGRQAQEELATRLLAHCLTYRGADTRRSLFQLVSTGAAFLAMGATLIFSIDYSYWITLLLAIPSAGLLVRLFIIQHDCGHGSFFKSRLANDMVGRLTSIFTLTPYGFWRQSHAVHHAGSGNLERRGIGDVDTLTVREYLNLPRLKRIGYRLYRNPLVLLIIGAPVHFLLLQRLPQGVRDPSPSAWSSVLSLNAVIFVVYGLLIALIGAKLFFMAFLPVAIISAWVGGWMFFIQHQFEGTHWDTDEAWDFRVAALYGSSYYVLPRVIQWFTGNIGLHHIHHLCSKVPNYRLQECLEASPDLQNLNRLTFWQSLKCVRLALWDEAQRKLVGFSHLKALPAAA